MVSLAQLVALGFGAGAIKHRRKTGACTSFTAGSTPWATAHRPPSPLARAMAAVLACGPNTALSHQSAAALWRIVPPWSAPIHVTAPGDRRHPGIHIHRSRHADATTHYGIRVTTPARTLVDLADVLTDRALTRAVNEAQVLRLTTPEELTTLLTRSHLEDDFIRFLKRHRLPLPDLNQTIAGHEVDAVYRDHHLVIELDSRQFHTTPRRSSRTATAMLTSSRRGFSTLRITDHRLKRHATTEAQRLRDILRSRSRSRRAEPVTSR